MNKKHTFLSVICLFFLLLPPVLTRAQVADGNPPSSNPQKFIFYWGKYQCDLSESNQFRARLNVTPEAFRQLIISPPSLWTGKELIKNMNFKLEGLSVSTVNYPTQLAAIDAHVSPLLKSGKPISLTELPLAAGLKGTVVFFLKPSAEKLTTMTGRSPYERNSYLNNNYMERVVWGREDIYETADRDFFSVNEFWQTVRQEPVVEWSASKKPLPLLADIQLVTKEKASISILEPLEEGHYPDILKNLENYRHMVHPGSIVTLQLKTAGQYDRMYQKTMQIVSDNDTRLRLRRKRDQHQVGIRWGQWSETIEELYLFRYTGPGGESLLADPSIARNSSIMLGDEGKAQWGRLPPECRIDGQPVSSDISFKVTLNDSLTLHVHSNDYDAEAAERFFKQAPIMALHIDSIQVEGYDFPHVQLSINLIRLEDNGLMVRNNLEILQQLAGNAPQIKLSSPEPADPNSLEFKFELPEKSKAIFSIFEPSGASVMSQNDQFAGGENRVKVPRSAFRTQGRHFAFINSVFGVQKVVFTVD